MVAKKKNSNVLKFANLYLNTCFLIHYKFCTQVNYTGLDVLLRRYFSPINIYDFPQQDGWHVAFKTLSMQFPIS